MKVARISALEAVISEIYGMEKEMVRNMYGRKKVVNLWCCSGEKCSCRQHVKLGRTAGVHVERTCQVDVAALCVGETLGFY